jgi:hypothetical protein
MAVKLEAQLVTVTRALAEVITTELARERMRTAQTGAGAIGRPSLLSTPARDSTWQKSEARR